MNDNYKVSTNSKEHLISLSTRFNKPLKHKKLLLLLNGKYTKAEVDILFSELNEKLESGSKVPNSQIQLNLKLNKNINYKTLEELKPKSIGIQLFEELKKQVNEKNKLESIKLLNRINNGKLLSNKEVEKLNKNGNEFTKNIDIVKGWISEWQ